MTLGEAGSRAAVRATRVGVVKERWSGGGHGGDDGGGLSGGGPVAKARVVVLGDEGGLEGVYVGARASRRWAW